MENSPFIDDFPIKTSIYKGFSMAMLNNQRVYDSIYFYMDTSDDRPSYDYHKYPKVMILLQYYVSIRGDAPT